MNITVRQANLDCDADGAAVLRLLDAYAATPMGDGKPLTITVKERLIRELAAFPTSIVFLAFDAEGEAVGLATCFLGFSTFAAQPLVNVSDFFVLPSSRGAGIGRLLLRTIEKFAEDEGCCRLTLEVQEKNGRARHLYESIGFRQAVYTAEAGGSLYYVKALSVPKNG